MTRNINHKTTQMVLHRRKDTNPGTYLSTQNQEIWHPLYCLTVIRVKLNKNSKSKISFKLNLSILSSVIFLSLIKKRLEIFVLKKSRSQQCLHWFDISILPYSPVPTEIPLFPGSSIKKQVSEGGYGLFIPNRVGEYIIKNTIYPEAFVIWQESLVGGISFNTTWMMLFWCQNLHGVLCPVWI